MSNGATDKKGIKDAREAATAINEEKGARIIRAMEFIVLGHMGEGLWAAARRWTKRMNRRANLGSAAIQEEFNLDARLANKVWHLLTPEVQAALNAGADKALVILDNPEE